MAGNVARLLRERELRDAASRRLQAGAQVTEALIRRLGLEVELEGHKGCVNCLEWSTDGRRIASGSDDTKVIIWDPFRHNKLKTISTPHIGNIFSVKFVGGSSDPLVVTAAGDCHVVVQEVESSSADAVPLVNCCCHEGRVKRLATAADQPQLFWSAAEDGMVVQFDLREQHVCMVQSSNVLLNLTAEMGANAEAKCLAVSPTRPYQLAVGANDCAIRLYDRRMLKGAEPQHGPAQGAVRYYSAGHLARTRGDAGHRYAVTYVAFNAAGTELLANVGADHVYLFDVEGEAPPDALLRPNLESGADASPDPLRECCRNGCMASSDTLTQHNVAIGRGRACACNYLARGRLLLARKWMGDTYCAARDYLTVIERWPALAEAHLGLVRSLAALQWTEAAELWLDAFCARFRSREAEARDLKTELAIAAANGTAAAAATLLRRPGAAVDFERRFVGHCNTTTDIKEANFLGPDGRYVVAGSDDGAFFIWERCSTELVRAMLADVSIVNCVQPHPGYCLLATSGIDAAVKLWSPRPEDGRADDRLVVDTQAAAEANQERLSLDPFESMLVNMGYRARSPTEAVYDLPTCRTS